MLGLLTLLIWCSSQGKVLTISPNLSAPVVGDSRSNAVYIVDSERYSFKPEEIAKHPILRLNPDFFLDSVGIRIVSFTLVIFNIEKNIPISFEMSYDNRISKASLKIIKKLKPGSRLFFENIKAMDPNKDTRKLVSLAILIK